MNDKRGPILLIIAVLLSLIAIGSWFYIKKTADPLTNELMEANRRAQGPNFDNPEDILNQLAKMDIEPENIAEATMLLSRLLTIERQAGPQGPHPTPAGPAWSELQRNVPPVTQLRMAQWHNATSYSGTTRYVLQLYEDNFGKTREAVQYLLNYKSNLPQIALLFGQAIYEKHGLEPIYKYGEDLSQEHKEAIRRLLENEEFLEWAKSKTVNLRQYAGNTDTVLGAYDWIASPEYAESVGFNRFPKKADVFLDLGGGFGTPDISRLLGHKFKSFDVIPPKMAKSLNSMFRVATSWRKPMLWTGEARMLTDKEREEYLATLEKTPFHRFNIFEDSFPTEHHSYFITSFGLIASSVGSHTNKIPFLQNPGVARVFLTTYVAVRRVVELVAAGKEVTLFSYTRGAPRLFQYQTALFLFRNHRLVDEKLRPLDMERASGELKRVALKAK